MSKFQVISCLDTPDKNLFIVTLDDEQTCHEVCDGGVYFEVSKLLDKGYESEDIRVVDSLEEFEQIKFSHRFLKCAPSCKSKLNTLKVGQRVQSLTQPRKQGKIIDLRKGKAQVSWDVGWRSGWCKLENLRKLNS